MKKHKSDLRSKLLYSDPAFIALVYEETTGESPITQVSNGATFGGKIGFGIADLTGTTHESKTFNLSTFRMLKIIEKNLSGYPVFNSETFDRIKGTQICWALGELTIGEWRDSKGPFPSTMVFELHVGGENSFTLVTQRELFVAGIGLLTQLDSVISQNISLPVEVLFRVLFYNGLIKSYIAAPYLILEAEKKP